MKKIGRKKILAAGICLLVLITILFIGLRSCGVLKIGLSKFSVEEDEMISLNGVYYERCTSAVPNLRPLKVGWCFGYVGYEQLFEISGQNREEWIYSRAVGLMMGWEDLYKDVSIEMPTIKSFNTKLIKIFPQKKSKKDPIIIDSENIISKIINILSDENMAISWEDYSKIHNISGSIETQLLSPDYPGMAFEYGLAYDETGKTFLEDVHGHKLYEINDILDSYINPSEENT